MGWASGGEIADTVADALIEANADDEVAEKVMTKVISALQQEDWDTEDESLEQYADYPAIVRAFAANGVRLREPDSE